MKKLTLFLATFLFSSIATYATHLVGGYVYYEHLESIGDTADKYLITFELYRDIKSSIDFDDKINVGIYANDNGKTLYKSLKPEHGPITKISWKSDCWPNFSPDLGYLVTNYQFEIILPKNNVGYYVSHVRCCRGNSDNILTNPSTGEPGEGNTFVTLIPPTDVIIDNSPKFNNSIAPRVVCVGIPYAFNLSATDIDDDELSYSLVHPYQGGDLISGYVSAHPEPPTKMAELKKLTNMPGYSYTDFLGPKGDIHFYNTTGILTIDAKEPGEFQAAAEVVSKRNGITTGAFIRQDFKISVINCPVNYKQLSVSSPSASFDFVDVNWLTCVVGAEEFKLERRIKGTSNWDSITTLATHINNYRDNDVTERTTYQYRIIPQPVDSFEYSNITETYVRSRRLYLIPQTEDRIIVNWEDVLLDPDGHILERTTDTAATWTFVGDFSAGINKYYDKGLTANTTYYYRVIGYKNSDKDTTYIEWASTFKLGTNKVNYKSIEIYPNPSNSIVNLKTDAPLTGELLIVNEIGQIVNQVSLVNSAESTINITTLNAGVYYFTIITDKATYRNKFIKLP